MCSFPISMETEMNGSCCRCRQRGPTQREAENPSIPSRSPPVRVIWDFNFLPGFWLPCLFVNPILYISAHVSRNSCGLTGSLKSRYRTDCTLNGPPGRASRHCPEKYFHLTLVIQTKRNIWFLWITRAFVLTKTGNWIGKNGEIFWARLSTRKSIPLTTASSGLCLAMEAFKYLHWLDWSI